MSDTIWAAVIAGGFAIAVALIAGFFTLRQSRTEDKSVSNKEGPIVFNGPIGRDVIAGNEVTVTYNNEVLLQRALKRLEEDLDRKNAELDKKEDIIAAQTAALHRLLTEQGSTTHPEQYHQALEAAAAGDVSLADQLLLEIEQRQASEAAEIAAERGALWFASDTHKALAAYKRATELDPNNFSAWNQLGHLNNRVGELDKAISAYEQILTLSDDKEWQAVAIGNLGLVYRTRGDLDKAEEYHLKALTLNEDLISNEGMADNYGNLGIVYQERGDLDRADEYHRKSLALHEKADDKVGIAVNYINLGSVYLQQGDLDKAEQYYLESLAMMKALGRKVDLADAYANLGLVCKTRGDKPTALYYWKKSFALYKKMGVIHMVENIQSWIDILETD